MAQANRRLRPCSTLAQAQAELETFFMRLAREEPDVYRSWDIRVESLHESAVGGNRKTLYILLGAAGFVLLISCANVANLLLARDSPRRKEMAIRSSLGAGRLRLIRQLITKSLLPALAGGALSGAFLFCPPNQVVLRSSVDSTIPITRGLN